MLYKCPYCAKGRFRGPNGWNEAKAHIRTHDVGSRNRKYREEKGAPASSELSLFDSFS